MDNKALQAEIRTLLTKRNAVLLVHYYQRDEVQEIADFLGDSLALSLEAAKTQAEVIVFAGVHFMAESASIICPDKTVLLPRLEAGCPLADMITAPQLIKAKKKHPNAAVVTYINSAAPIKALSDTCCTSANAIDVVNSMAADEILMIPDGNLARNTAAMTDKKIIPWGGYCPVHHFLTVEDIRHIRKEHPNAPLAVHPECLPEVAALADFVGSTTAILKYARESREKEIIIGTEVGIFYRMRKENPDKIFIPASGKLVCETMKMTSLSDIHAVLSEMKHIVKVPEEIRVPAKRALDRMFDVFFRQD